MTLPKLALGLGLILSIAACGGAASRFAVNTPTVTENVRVSFAAIEVRDVSLPSYAASDEISIEAEDGTLYSSSDVLWADAPERAIALQLSQTLARMTGRRVASEPWPFEAFPDARVEVRFAELVAKYSGVFHTSGQYFVAVTDGRRERSGLFDLNVPFNPEGGPSAIAAARGQLILNLAEFIARDGLR